MLTIGKVEPRAPVSLLVVGTVVNVGLDLVWSSQMRTLGVKVSLNFTSVCTSSVHFLCY